MQRGETVDLRELFSRAEPDVAGGSARIGEKELARIVRAATSLQARRETLSAVRCLSSLPCDGYLKLRLQDIPPIIVWQCSECSSGGCILNWPRTPWDLSHLATGFESDPLGPLCEIPLAPEHYQSLHSLENCDEAFQKIIFSAVPRGEAVLLQGDLPDFLYLLERCIERSGAPESRRQSEALNQICSSLDATIRELERRKSEPARRNGRDLDEMDLPGWLPPDLADRLRRALEDGHFSSIDDLNDQLALTMDAYNRRPCPDLAGLSPYQVSDLLGGAWEGGGALCLNPKLQAEQLSQSMYYRNARRLLETLQSERALPLTARGNLTRRLVRQLIDECSISFAIQPPRVINELDVPQIHIPRVICQLGGLLKRRGRRFLLTKRGLRMLEPSRAGELYRHLFETFFRKFNLAYLDGSVENPALQDTVAFSLYALHRQEPVWESAQTLAPRILLPAAFETALNLGDDQPTWQSYTRLLLPMYHFGLLEFRIVKRKRKRDPQREFRPSPIFHEFVQFSI